MKKDRSQIDPKFKWAIDEMCPSAGEWDREIEDFKKGLGKIDAFPGSLNKGAEQVKKCLESRMNLLRKLDHLFTYAHLKHDEKTDDSAWRGRYDIARAAWAEIMARFSFLEPELLSLPEDDFQTLLEAKELKHFRRYLERLSAERAHILSEKEERLLASLGPVINASGEIFRAFNDADIKFPEILDEDDKPFQLTHGSFYRCLITPNRRARKDAFLAMFDSYSKWKTTLATTLATTVKKHSTEARLRSYSSSLEAALHSREVSTDVYTRLIETVRERIGVHRRYLDLRRRVLKLDDLQFYDLYVPMMETPKREYTPEESVDLMFQALRPLGDEYLRDLEDGVKGGWIDWFECDSKRTGAYSSGCHTSKPYILLNHDGTLNSVFTLLHEAGHSMHTHLSNVNQPWPTHDYPIFLAEVASTFNEQLFARHLMNQDIGRTEKLYLVNQELERIRATFIRQTMFADFEFQCHRHADEGKALTPDFFIETYSGLLKLYFGDDFPMCPGIEYEWSRIPHFHYDFYVYQYATGIAAAISLADRVCAGGEKERNDYLSFLSAGGSKPPIDTLRMAGVDMTDPAPVHAVLDRMATLIDQYESLLESSDS